MAATDNSALPNEPKFGWKHPLKVLYDKTVSEVKNLKNKPIKTRIACGGHVC
jgi:hypothetical protein